MVPKAPGAKREFLFVNFEGVRNVVPILDQGEIDDCWVLIMPKAAESLRKKLTRSGGKVPSVDAIAILNDVATALVDLEKKAVHRDLKPENILHLDGKWCLADFGISRYAEASTATDTHKFSMTPPYAAPEQWRAEHATSATDIYAFGCIACEILSGSVPFSGPRVEDLRHQHLHEAPAELKGVDAGVAALIHDCLRKSPGSRPSAAAVLARLAAVATTTTVSGGFARLKQANLNVVTEESEAERKASALRSEIERRKALLADSQAIWAQITGAVRREIATVATAARHLDTFDAWSAVLNSATLELYKVQATERNPWGNWQPPAFAVIAHATIRIKIPRDHWGYEGRGHSIWFCDAHEAGHYDWFETAFMITPMIQKSSSINPFPLDPCELSAKAVCNGLAEVQPAWPFTPLRQEAATEFIDRWIGWFADAATGKLHYPRTMPEKSPQNSWRNR